MKKGIVAMSLLSRLFGIWAIGKTVSSTTPLFLRLIMGMAAITVLSVVGAILIVVFIVGTLWFIHAQLIAGGTTPQLAGLITGELVLLIMAAILLLTRSYWRKIKLISSNIINMNTPVSSRVSGIADSFMNGFMSPERR